MKTINHGHLRVGAVNGQKKFYKGPKAKCPFCNEDRKEVEQEIWRYLVAHDGWFVLELTLRSTLRQHWPEPEISRAIAALHPKVNVCYSCQCVVSKHNPHRHHCPHSAEDV